MNARPRPGIRTAMLAPLVIAIVAVSAVPSVGAATYTIDKAHSSVTFKIRHLFSRVQGAFDEFEGTLEYAQGQPESWSVKTTLQAASINTKVAARDKHLRSDDFFAVETFPTLEFVSTQATDVSADTAKLHGNLTLHGVTKPVVLDVQIHGVGQDPWGNTKAGFTATTQINRKDFGLNWNEVLETGDVLVGNEVDITIEIEATLQ